MGIGPRKPNPLLLGPKYSGLHSPHQALFALSFSLNGSRWPLALGLASLGLRRGWGRLRVWAWKQASFGSTCHTTPREYPWHSRLGSLRLCLLWCWSAFLALVCVCCMCVCLCTDVVWFEGRQRNAFSWRWLFEVPRARAFLYSPVVPYPKYQPLVLGEGDFVN